MILLSHRFGYDARLYYWFQMNQHAEGWQGRSVWLPDYRVDIEARPVDGIGDNLSGLAYDPHRGHLWSVVNAPTVLIALTLSGDVIARYPLEGFKDVEAVAYMGPNQLLVVEERRQTLVVIDLPEAEGPLQRDGYPFLTLELFSPDNNEFEGATYDPVRDRLYLAKERKPLRLYEIDGLQRSLGSNLALSIRDITASLGRRVFATDLSSVAFEPHRGHLILLSDESKLMIELSEEGEFVSFASLARGFSGLSRGIPQAEGVAMDHEGHLYIVSEPNLFYRFEKRSEVPSG
ncbi:SdiA-regulated domain-containing protein [Stutzerimonas tarimensis]|uniref:SdiA-regulated domain-containing protein n=1 Tax=Stutzerimonas tarimensis TaxID=1507735 RepID=A0ABV7T2R2_9GAMM